MRCLLLTCLWPFLLARSIAAQPPDSTIERDAQEAGKTFRNLAYVRGGHERQKLDLYLPDDPDDVPLIIWIHGGAFRAGSKDDITPEAYLDAGYAVASINYRLSQHALFPAQIEDVKAAVRWLRANANQYGLDSGRFGAWGASAGGHLAAMLGVTGDVEGYDVGENLHVSSRVQVVVDYYGPTDFLQMDAQRLPDGMIHDAPNSPESQLIGGPIQDNVDLVARANPIAYVSPQDPAFLIVHGDVDPLVPFGQSLILRDALEEAGVPVSLYLVRGEGHGNFQDPEVEQLTRRFLARHLQPGGR